MAKKQTSRGRKQDRVAGGQDYEVWYEEEKSWRPKAAVKKAVKKGGNRRKGVKAALGR